nr:helix-hairpin-helix domain-containing protein [Nitrospiraceae bacterium]
PEAISVAKDPDRVFSPQLPEPLAIEDARPSSLLLKRIRDEVHRFAISFHRKLRGKGLFASPLESVKGIGRKRRLELLRHFGSVEAMREAPIEKLTETRGVTPQLAEEIKKVLARPGSEL